MKLNGFVFILCLWSYGVCFSSQIPEFIQKYYQQLPHLQEYQGCALSNEDKAHIIANYCCLFIPKKPNLCIEGIDDLQGKLLELIDQEQKISLVLLGFPFKSTNHEKKCLSAHVDLGEYLSLMTLNAMVHNIKGIYPHVQCAIISDGLSYHIEDYDPSYDEIFAYHKTMKKLMNCFSDISFVSWKLNEHITSYTDLQQQVLTMSLPSEAEFSKGYKGEMRAFVTKEFDCTWWNDIFLRKAEKMYEDSGKIMKEKQKQQEVSRIKNELMNEQMNVIVEELGCRGKQYSTFVGCAFPHYHNSIRLSVHCNKNNIDVSKKIPISLVYGCNGTPWHNAVVVNEQKNEIMGLFKDCFSAKKASFASLDKHSLTVTNSAQEAILLQYIAYGKS